MTAVYGHQTPRFNTGPAYEHSPGDEAIELARLADVHLDPWQQLVLRDSLGENGYGPNRKWAAFEVGLVVPRQSGKGECLLARELFGLFLEDREKLILHSAHEFKTSVEAFNRIKERILGSDWLSRKMKGPPRTAHGEEGFELKNGSRLRFVARSSGSGRGFTCDCLILDEAFNLSDNAMAALLPTLQARPNPQIWYTSSAGMQSSETLRKVRIRGRRGDPRLRYFEWSCPEDADLDDQAAWAQANPALGYRLRMEGIASLRAAMNDDTFGREILGIWDEDNVQTMIDLRLWAELADPQSRPGNSLVFAVDVKPDRTAAAISSSGKRVDGRIHVKIVDHREGVDWIVDRLRVLNEKYHPRAIVLDPSGPAGSLLADLADLNIEPVLVTGREMAQACGAFHTDVLNDRIRHTGQEALTSALRQATTRNLGDAWAWDRRDSRGDICPLVAATLATHGFRLHGSGEPARPWVMFG